MAKCPEGCTCNRHRTRGVARSADVRAKISASKLGHEVAAETRAKISAATKGRKASKSTKALMSQTRTDHGHNHRGRRSPTYRSWDGMKQRCLNPKATSYARYGGAGITVADRWLDFGSFLEDMGARPDGTTLDRIDSTRGYEPGNCRWATRSEQNKNRPNFDPRKR